MLSNVTISFRSKPNEESGWEGGGKKIRATRMIAGQKSGRVV